MPTGDEGTRGDRRFGTIGEMLAAGSGRYGDRPAVVDGRSISYAELDAAAWGASRALLALDVAHGERVAIWAPNLLEWVVAALGVHRVGGVLVPINTRYRGAEAAFILNKARVRVLFTVADFLDTDYPALLAQAPVPVPTLAHTVILRGGAPAGAVDWADFLAGGVAIDEALAAIRAEAVGPEDFSDILFTSGTTGQPKGAMVTHGQSLRAYLDWATVVGLREGDRYLVVAPFFHCFGYKAGWLAALMTGATVYPQAVFDVDQVLGRIGPDQITMLPGPPALYQTILARSDLASFDLSSLRLAVTGAAVIPVSLIHAMRDTLGFDTVITGYGLTEASGIATMCRYDDDPEVIARTSGRAIPGVEVRVVDGEGRDVSAGAPGEVQVRGYNVMQGYLDEPAQTEAAVDGDGWLRTGDVGVMDAAGYVRITDRVKDMFIVGGFNAYPAEIELMLMDHPDVADVAVVGAPDPRLGEVGVAFVVLRPETNLDADALVAWSRDRMANFKVPRRVRFVERLPRNATGKVQKFLLRAGEAT